MDFVGLVKHYVPSLRRIDADWLVAPCPFHEEHTPSFSISPERKEFRCYGCRRSGDVFGFVQRVENLYWFSAAVEVVARYAGVELEVAE